MSVSNFRRLDRPRATRLVTKPERAATWAVVGHVILGVVLLFAMTSVGQMEMARALKISADEPEAAGLIIGWWIGGTAVLRFFWATWRRGEQQSRPLVS